MNVNSPKKIIIPAFFDINNNKILKNKWEKHYNIIFKRKHTIGTSEHYYMKKIKEFEKNFVDKNLQQISSSRGICKAIIENRHELDLENLLSKSNDRFFNIKLMEMLACISNLSINIDSPYRNPDNPNIKMFWGNLKRISGGAFGDVFITSPDQLLDKAFALKYIRPLISYDYKKNLKYVNNDVLSETIHEIFIAKILNNYRNVVPNFMYGYGYFSCSDPIRTLNKGKKSICSLSGNSYYSIYERILPGTTLNKYIIGGTTLTKILDKYLQVLLALNTVSNLKYTHYDLHAENVIMRDLPVKNAVIPYINPVTNKTIYIKTDYIATIIDFGYSYIELRKIGYGMSGAEHASTYPDRPNQIMDAFKLFMFIVQNLYGDQKQIVDQLRPIFKFFDTKNNIEHYLKERLKDRYYTYDIPRTTRTRKYTHIMLIKHIMSNYADILNNKVVFNKIPEGSVLLSCGANGIKCVPPSEIISKNFLKNPDMTMYNFFDLMRSNNIRKENIVKRYNANFDQILKKGTKNIKNLTHQSNLLLEKMDKLINPSKSLLTRAIELIYKREDMYVVFKRITSGLLDLEIIIGILSELSVRIDSFNYFLAYYKKKEHNELKKTINDSVNEVVDHYKKIGMFIKTFFNDNKIEIGLYYKTLNNMDKEEFEIEHEKLIKMYDIVRVKITNLYSNF